MRNDFNSNYLEHHGILGMHWGKRNGPPYPLDAADHSQSEKKAGYKKSLGGGRNESLYDRKRAKVTAKYDKKISRVQKDIDSFKPIENGLKDKKGREILSKKDVEESVKGLKNLQDKMELKKQSKLRKIDERETYKQNNPGLTDEQKKALKIGFGVAAGVAITAGAAYVAKKQIHKAVMTGLAKESKAKGEAYVHEFLRMKRNADNAAAIAKAAKEAGNKTEAKLFEQYSDRFFGNAEVARGNALREGGRRQSYNFDKSEQLDYITRKLTGRHRQFTREELADLGIRTIGLDDVSSMSGDAYNDLLEYYLKKYGLTGSKVSY